MKSTRASIKTHYTRAEGEERIKRLKKDMGFID